MKVFIASSSESLNYARALKHGLVERCRLNIVLWNEAPFELGSTIIESLEKLKSQFDFAIFLFHPDDEINFRSAQMKSVRDNVIFEFGIFTGVLGIKKCFAVIPDNIKIKQPSDILGVNYAKYKYSKNEKNAELIMQNVIKEICDSIKSRLKQVDKSNKLVRGDFRYSIVDASINVDLSDDYLYSEWINSIKIGQKVYEELLYWDRHTAKRWLEYEKYAQFSTRQLNEVSKKVKNIVSDTFDYISLGPGSGRKDIQILKSALKPIGEYWYYPIDISYHLLCCAMKNVTGEFDDSRLKVKGIKANFTALERLKFVYNYRHSKHVFSLLGNTLGNYEESELLNNLSLAMNDEDLLIIEVNNIEGLLTANHPKYIDDNYSSFILEPLRSLGICPQKSNLKFEELGNLTSSIDGSRRIFANYYFDNKERKSVGLQKLNITYSTHYDINELTSFISNHGFKCIHCISDHDNIMILFEKQNDG